MQRLLAVLTLFGGLAYSAVAHADTFTFNLSGTGGTTGTGLFSGSGTLTAAPSGTMGAELISGITGTNVTTFLQPGTFNGDDDLIYPSGPDFLDGSGFAFIDQNSTGVYHVDIYENTSGYFAFVQDSDLDTVTVPVNFSIVPTAVTSEPSSNWRALKPGQQDTPDADKTWNALSLPFVIGPHGRIGLLEPAALQTAPH